MIVYATLNSKYNVTDVKTTRDDRKHIDACVETDDSKQHSKLLNRLIKYAFILITGALLGFFLYITIPTMYLPHDEVALLTPQGWISGKREELSGNQMFFSFKGIPYALPPIGKLRFQPPVPYLQIGRHNLHKAHHFAPNCVQYGDENKIIGDEDCLYLNVFTPSINRDDLLPVFVWIHGGNLMTGGSYETQYSLDKTFVTSMNVVGVSMNYRLNAFGFLTLKELWEEGKSYGNYGIMDQILVLKWIQNNIKNFGGNPNSVTIVGQGSGGTSVFALLSSPLADGLFHKAVSMSGSPNLNIDYKTAANHNRIFLQATKCKKIASKFIKDCLLNLTANEIMKAIPFYNFPNWGNRDTYDIPKKDLLHGALLVVDPVVVVQPTRNIKQINYKTKTKIPVMIGTTAQEICYNPVYNFHNSSIIELKTFLKKRFHPFSSLLYNEVVNKRYKKIIQTNPSPQDIYEIIATDIRMTCPTNNLFHSLQQSNKHIAYRYIVTNHPSNPISIHNKTVSCSFHGWDSMALFGLHKIPGYKPNEFDLKFEQHFRESFKYFMQHGRIPHYSIDERIFKYTRYGIMIRILNDYHHNQCKAWKHFENYAWIN